MGRPHAPASVGPAIPSTAHNKGADNYSPISTTVKSERQTAARDMAQKDGSVRHVPSATRTDY